MMVGRVEGTTKKDQKGGVNLACRDLAPKLGGESTNVPRSRPSDKGKKTGKIVLTFPKILSLSTLMKLPISSKWLCASSPRR